MTVSSGDLGSESCSTSPSFTFWKALIFSVSAASSSATASDHLLWAAFSVLVQVSYKSQHIIV